MMKNSIFRAIAAVFVLAVLGLPAGCTSGADQAPFIANLVYFPSVTPVSDGGSVTVNGTFNVESKSSDIASVNTIVDDASGKKVAESTIKLDDPSLSASNTPAFSVDVKTSTKGKYTFHVFAVDGKGRRSNGLDGTLEVTGLF